MVETMFIGSNIRGASRKLSSDIVTKALEAVSSLPMCT